MIFNFCFSSNSPVAFGSGLFSKRVKTETSNLRVIKNPKHMKNKIEPVTQYCLRHGVGTTNVAHLWSSFKYDKQMYVKMKDLTLKIWQISMVLSIEELKTKMSLRKL